ncbi:MAG: rod shape-determining protein MreC [Oscillospiraceae bacterium]|nr:rod shape-determining protein MreC [Oscillospiraceae bacterium]
MKEFFKGRAFRAIVCILAVIIGIMIHQAASGNYASFSEAAIGTVVTPVVKVSSAISDKVAGFFNMLLSAKDTQKENEELKKQLAEAYKGLGDLEKYKNENEQLKKFMEIKEHNPDYKMQSAMVIGRDSSSRFGSFTIDKGSLNSVSVNAPVITEAGLVGIVTHVGPTYSVVTTILDPEINVGAYNSRIQSTGVIGGTSELYESGKTKLRLLPRDTELLSGDIIETSGIGGVFPAGILIGTVDVIKAENSGVSMYAEINPIVDVMDVTDVMIITDFSVDENPIDSQDKTEDTEQTESSTATEENQE